MKQTLYYGTDARFFKMDEDEREFYDRICYWTIEYLYPKFEPYFEPENNLEKLFKENNVSYEPSFLQELCSKMYWAKHPFFLGERFYRLYTTRLVAHRDAINDYAGDGIGKTAYLLIKAAELLHWIGADGLDHPYIFKIKTTAESKAQPVIFTFTLDDSELPQMMSSEDLSSHYFFEEEEFKDLLSKSDYVVERVDRDIAKALKKRKNVIPYLYHGTDERIIKMSVRERNQYINDCKLVVDSLWKRLTSYLDFTELSDAMVGGNLSKLVKYCNLFDSRNNVPMLWTMLWDKEIREERNEPDLYGSLCLTSSEKIAKEYALHSYAGGRLGYEAHSLIDAAESMRFEDLHADKALSSAMERVKAFETDQNSRKPVVVKVQNVDPSYLLTATGESIDWLSESFYRTDFRYMKKGVKLDLDSADPIEKFEEE